MRSISLAAAVLLAACSGAPEAPSPDAEPASAPEAAASPPPVDPIEPAKMATDWQRVSSGEETALFLPSDGDAIAVSLICSGSGRGFAVNVPVFEPIGSEERMSFGAGGTVVALVADSGGDALRGGVTGEGDVPAQLATIVGDPEGIGVSYGAQVLGPLPAIPADTARDFVAACAAA